MLVDIGPAGTFTDDGMQIVEVEGKELGIIGWQGQVYAVRNLCPHLLAPVCGFLTPHLTRSDPGTVEVDMDRPVVACAWHRWEFDVRTGGCLVDEKLKITTYPVHIQGDRALVELPDHGRRRPIAEEGQ